MGIVSRLPVAMATLYRCRALCRIEGEQTTPAVLDVIDGGGARLATRLVLPVGDYVILHHPHAGPIAARVTRSDGHTLTIAFDRSKRSVAFALAAIVADMSKPEA